MGTRVKPAYDSLLVAAPPSNRQISAIRHHNRSRDKGAAAHHRLGSEDRDQPIRRVDTVLQRDDRGLRPDYWADLLTGGLDVPQLDAQQDAINETDA